MKGADVKKFNVGLLVIMREQFRWAEKHHLMHLIVEKMDSGRGNIYWVTVDGNGMKSHLPNDPKRYELLTYSHD